MKDNEIRSYVFIFFGLLSYSLAESYSYDFLDWQYIIFGLASVICMVVGIIYSFKKGG